MWVCLIGPPTCKQKVAEDLRETAFFTHEMINYPAFPSKFPDMVNLNLLDQYYRQTLDMQRRMDIENLVTISSFWSQYHVYSKALLECKIISQQEFDIVQKYYVKMAIDLDPPSFFIHLTASHIDVRNRINLKTEYDEREEWVEAIRENTHKLAELIRVPVIEVDAGQSYDKVWESIEFDIREMKTTRLADQTLWQRTVYHTGRLQETKSLGFFWS